MIDRALRLVLLLTLLAPAQAQRTLYVYGWFSQFPVAVTRVEVTGGSLVQVLTASDGLSGTIAVTAPRACVTIRAEGATTTGIAVRLMHAWDAECDRFYVPLVRT